MKSLRKYLDCSWFESRGASEAEQAQEQQEVPLVNHRPSVAAAPKPMRSKGPFGAENVAFTDKLKSQRGGSSAPMKS